MNRRTSLVINLATKTCVVLGVSWGASAQIEAGSGVGEASAAPTAPMPAPAPTATPAQAAAPVASGETPAKTSQTRKSLTVLLSRVVGEVGEHIVTSREVRINEAVERALAEQRGEKPSDNGGVGAVRVLTGSEKIFPAETGKVLDEWIVYLEAKSLSVQPAAKAEVTEAVKNVHEFWNGKTAWQELEVASDELREMIERKLIAKSFVKLKNDPNLAPISDDDALAYYRKNRMRFGSLPFSSFKDSIKSFLMKSQMERRLAEWRDVLRRKYKVRNLIAG